MDRSRGILYVATGETYRQEAVQSAESFKVNMPDVPIAIFADDTASLKELGCFDVVHELPECEFSYVDKLAPLKASPFPRTLFVDTDTYCVTACHDVFDLLDRFDLAAAHAPLRAHYYFPPSCPPAFPELNTGVIAYRNTEEFGRLVDNWLSIFRSQAFETDDQPAFREAVYASPIRLGVLPPEYNLRTCFAYFLGGNADVKIVHDRGQSLQNSLEILRSEPKTLFPRSVDIPPAGGAAKLER